jgi:hypothetical protein
MIDTVLLMLVTMPLLWWIYGPRYFDGSIGGMFAGPADFLISFVLPALAVILFWRHRQATPGKMMLSLRVVDAESGGPPTLGQGVGRYFAYFVSTLPLGPGFPLGGLRQAQAGLARQAGAYGGDSPPRQRRLRGRQREPRQGRIAMPRASNGPAIEGRGTADYRAYSRDHVITAPGRPELAGSSDPAFRGDATRWNPEDLLLASLSSCHMLWYLHLCSAAGIVVTAYRDEAEGSLVGRRRRRRALHGGGAAAGGYAGAGGGCGARPGLARRGAPAVLHRQFGELPGGHRSGPGLCPRPARCGAPTLKPR